MKYDVIVIGAGNGGLVAALTLQKNGKNVLLLEAQNVPGGFATSFVRGRFEFEASLHELYGYGNEVNHGDVYELFERLGIKQSLSMHALSGNSRVISLNTHEEYDLPVMLSSFISTLESYVPGSTPSVQAFFDLALEVWNAMHSFRPDDENIESILLKECPLFFEVATSSLEEVFERFKIPKKVREILSTYWIYLGSPSRDLSFVHYASMIFSYLHHGPYIPTQFSHDISVTLQNEFERLGGTIRFFSKVKKILFQEDKISGVECVDGSVFYSDYLISNVAYPVVYGSLIPREKLTKEMIQLCNARTLGARGFAIYLGLNKSPQELGLTHYSYFIYDSMDSNIEAKRMKELYHRGCIARVRENANLGNSNTTTLVITSFLFGDDFDKVVTKDNYFALKEKIAKHFISVFENATNTNILDAIEEIEIATPVTFAKYGGHPSGTIYGYLAKGYDNLIPRMMNANREKYIPNLYFCGGFGTRLSGFGSSYLSGEDAALELMKDMEKGE